MKNKIVIIGFVVYGSGGVLARAIGMTVGSVFNFSVFFPFSFSSVRFYDWKLIIALMYSSFRQKYIIIIAHEIWNTDTYMRKYSKPILILWRTGAYSDIGLWRRSLRSLKYAKVKRDRDRETKKSPNKWITTRKKRWNSTHNYLEAARIHYKTKWPNRIEPNRTKNATKESTRERERKRIAKTRSHKTKTFHCIFFMILFHKIIHLVWFLVYSPGPGQRTHIRHHISVMRACAPRARVTLHGFALLLMLLSLHDPRLLSDCVFLCVCVVHFCICSMRMILSFLWLLIWMFLHAREPKYHVLMIFLLCALFSVVILMLARSIFACDSQTAYLNV